MTQIWDTTLMYSRAFMNTRSGLTGPGRPGYSELMPENLIRRRPSALTIGPCLSRHIFLDEEGYLGTRSVHGRGARLTVRHRYSGAVLLDVTLGDRHPDYLQGVQKGWTDVVAKYVRKVERNDSGGVGERALDEAFMADYPALHEYLTLDWTEGQRRETSTLGISVDGGRWKCRLADRDNGLVTFISGDGLYAVLGALERALADGSADWREDQFAKPKTKNRK